MTDNPSSSVPASKDLAREMAKAAVAPMEGASVKFPLAIEMASSNVAARIQPILDSALASQEARHRQEMEEAKRALDADRGELAVTKRLFENITQRAEAAEQREREAGEKLATLRDVAARLQGERCVLAMARIMDEATVEQVQAVGIASKALDAALAAIRPAPSPVSAPPTKGIQCKHTCPENGHEWTRVETEPGQACNYGTVLLCPTHLPASPVEPGSDPQEPETR